MRWLCILFVLYGCSWSLRGTANDDAKVPRKKILLVSETLENREQSLISGRLYLQKFYEVVDTFAIKRIAQTKLVEALDDKYDTVVLFAIGKLDKQERNALKQFQLDGGKLIWFLQGNADLRFYHSLAVEMDRPLMPVVVEEYVELAEDKALSVTDCSLLDKQSTRDLFFCGYWKINSRKTQEHSINAMILSDGGPALVYNSESRTAVVLVATQPVLSNWVESVSWVVLLLELHATLDSEPTTGKNASAADTDR